MPESQSIQIIESELETAQYSPATIVASVKFFVKHLQNGDYIITYAETVPAGGVFTSTATTQNRGHLVLLGTYVMFTAQTNVGNIKFYL